MKYFKGFLVPPPPKKDVKYGHLLEEIFRESIRTGMILSWLLIPDLHKLAFGIQKLELLGKKIMSYIKSKFQYTSKIIKILNKKKL